MSKEYLTSLLLTTEISLKYYPDPSLRTECKECTWPLEERTRVGNEMLKIMYDNNGYGLAASQVGLDQRLFVMRYPDDIDKGLIVSNPKIEIWGKDYDKQWEGCLSLLSHKAMVRRCTNIEFTYDDLSTGDRICMGTMNINARCVQHEIDHLDGILVFDHIQSELGKKIFLEKYSKAKRKHDRIT